MNINGKNIYQKQLGSTKTMNLERVFDDTNYFGTLGYVIYDSFDHKIFPTKGFYFKGNFNFYFYANGINENFNEFSIGRAKIGYAKTIIKNFLL